MPRTRIQIIHDFLINEDFTPVTSRNESFQYHGTLIVSSYSFKLGLSFHDLDFVELPTVKVLSWPDGIPTTLPHVYEENRLCYLDSESINLDRYDPYSSFHIIFEHIKTLLKSFLPKNHKYLSDEFADEFTLYWNRDSFNQAYIRSFSKNCVASIFDRKNIIEPESISTEVILHDDNETEQLNHWLRHRNVIEPDTSAIISGVKPTGAKRLCDVIIVDIKKPSLIPIDTNWPPTSTEELLLWLNRLDQGSANHLAYRIEQTIHGSNRSKKKNSSKKRYKNSYNKQKHITQLSVFVILSTLSGHVGILIEFHKAIASIIANNFGRNKKQVDVHYLKYYQPLMPRKLKISSKLMKKLLLKRMSSLGTLYRMQQTLV